MFPATRKSAVDIVRVVHADDALVEAYARLLPQLSRTASALTLADLQAIVDAPGTDVFIAIAKARQRIVGTLTLVHFRIPTDIRTWIEDVVVDRADNPSHALPEWPSTPRRAASRAGPARFSSSQALRPKTQEPNRSQRRSELNSMQVCAG